MKPKYIQLPPLQADLPLESIEMIWTYAQMKREEQGLIRDMLETCVEGRAKELEHTEFARTLEDTDIEVSQEIMEYNELMKRLIGSLIAQACETAGIVYQNYCVKGKTLEEIAREYNLDQGILHLMAQYYDRKWKTL